MSDEELEFEEFFQQKLRDEHELIKSLPQSMDVIREIYRQDWDWERKIPE